jgi:hypothetical protein
MTLITKAITSAISTKIIDALSKKAMQESAERLTNLFRDKRPAYIQDLSETIQETIEGYEAEHPIGRKNRQQIAFYDSQVIIEELLKYRFFNKYSFSKITKDFDKNQKIIYKAEQLKTFLKLFDKKAAAKPLLKQLGVNEGYKNEIYKFSATVGEMRKPAQEIFTILEKIREQVVVNNKNIEEIRTWPHTRFEELKQMLNKQISGTQRINTIDISGNNNIILQDVNGNKININQFSNENIKKYISGFASGEFNLYNKVFIYCNPADRFFAEQKLIPELQKADIPIYLDIKDTTVGDFNKLNTIIKESRRTIIIYSDNFSKKDYFYFEAFKEEQQDTALKKLLPVTINGKAFAPIPEMQVMDLSRAETLKLKIHALINTLRKEYGLKTPKEVFPALGKEHIDITRLPYGGEQEPLYGRKKELDLLDRTWKDHAAKVITFIADGGVGKSALINRWVHDIGKDHYRAAEKVFAWSFYSQGTNERVTSAERFIDTALRWFGESGFETLSARDKGKGLAKRINEHRTVLILDGLEPLQSAHAIDKGKIKDPALETLLKNLNKQNKGLCIITSRIALQKPPFGGLMVNLEHISKEAGRTILKRRGIRGENQEIEQCVKDFGNHALAVNLLGEYLRLFDGRTIRKAKEIPELPNTPKEKGKHARRVISALYSHFKKIGLQAEYELLKLSGLFDRPMPKEDLIELASSRLSGFENLISSERAINTLRRYKLFYPESTHSPDTIDCHPIIREHFADELQKKDPAVWKKANAILYNYYKTKPKKHLPDTLEEMEPLFWAVAYGCRAGMHKEALYDVYWERINRKKGYILKKLGAFGSDLAALSNFFDIIWDKPTANITEADKILVTGLTGFALGAVGNLYEAAKVTEISMKMALKRNNWINSSIAAGNISELYLITGNAKKTISFAQQAVKYAVLSKNWEQEFTANPIYAEILYHIGEIKQATELYEKTELKLRKHQVGREYLYSLSGFRYCELLLYKKKYKDVLVRAKTALDIVINGSGNLLDIALNKLSIGKAFLAMATEDASLKKFDKVPSFVKLEEAKQAGDYINQAVNGLQKAGTQDHFPKALLARAEYYRYAGRFVLAREDLEEVLEISESGGMKFYLTDYHIEMYLLLTAHKQSTQAKKHKQKALDLIEETGYKRALEKLKH